MSNIEKIRQAIERRLQRENEILWNAKKRGTYPSPSCEYNLLTLTSLRDFIDSLPEEKPSEDLEEAAENYRRKSCNAALEPNIDGPMPEYGGSVKEAFIAGAEWQERHVPLPEDTVLFQKGVEEGKRLIMEEAVEGEIGYWNQRGLSIRLDKSLERLGYGEDTKVRIIIVKQ